MKERNECDVKQDAHQEMVDHPAHYNNHPSGVECIDIIEWMPANVAAAMKYLWRCNEKHPDPIEDLRKAEWYVRREIDRLERTRDVF